MHIFFDLDGVLIDLKELHRDAFITSWNHICRQSPIDIPFHTKHLEARPTSDGHIWCYPGRVAGSRSIVVMPERVPGMAIDYSTIAGICSDYVSNRI